MRNAMLKWMEQTQGPLLPKYRTALGLTSASVAEPPHLHRQPEKRSEK